jgi:amino acid adenylation domain-containing protein
MAYAQQQLWFLEQLQPGTTAYNNPGAVLLEGPLDIEALARSLGEIVRRHEALRTTFFLDAGEPVQAIREPRPDTVLDLPLIDLSALPVIARQKERENRISEEAHRPFDLAHGPVLRGALLRTGAREHVALLTMHHIVSDEWSHNILIRELGQLYDAFQAGQPSPLGELPVQFGDFAAWQRSTLQSEALERHLDYWRQEMAGAPPVLALPADRPRPAVQSLRGASVPFQWPSELGARLAELGRGAGATRFMTMAAGFLALLHRVSHQDDLVISTSSGHRGRQELEPLIGCFLNVVLLRTEVADQPSFADLLARVRQAALGALAHQDLPFEMLVEALRPERDLAYNPLAQVMLVVQNAPSSTFELRDLVLTRLEVERRTAQLDLTLHVWERPDGLGGFLEHSTDLFETATVERLLAQLRRLLAAAAEDPARPIGELPLLVAADERQVVHAWNATCTAYPEAERGACLHELLAEQAGRTPEAVAVEIDGCALTYRELRARALGLAARLRALGVGPDVPVGLCAERSIELVVSLLGILEAGGAYVPLDPGDPADRLAWILADAKAGTLLVQPHLVETLPAQAAPVVLLDPQEVAASSAEPPPPAKTSPESLAYVIYTSGSTGRPKGAMNTHAAIVNRLLWMQEAYGLTPDDRVLQKTPFSFDVSVWEFFWPLITGARLVLARPGGHRDPAYLARRIEEAGITTLHFVPSMLRAFLAEAEVEGCGAVRRVIASGEALPAELVRRFYARFAPVGRAVLHNLYGPTEAAVDVTAWPCERDDPRAIVPIGRPIANLRVHLLDRGLQPVPAGVVGELYIGGAGLARGYLDRPALTAERFVPDPLAAAVESPGARLYRTGDLARFRTDGAIEFLGRVDQQVKLRGFRIELGEIEAVLAGHPGVAQAVVLLRGDELAAFLVPAAGGAPTPAELRAFLREKLPEHMVPALFSMLDELPRTSSGKVDRRALAQIEVGRSARALEELVAPRNPLEEQLSELWQEVLGTERIGVHDSFFALGGHSLRATQLLSRLHDTFHVTLPLREIFARPTIAGMAVLIIDRLLEQMGAETVSEALAETELPADVRSSV